jgi:NhaA family Na+:H+ antiporter
MEPWSSYAVLPIFALANAGLVWSTGIIEGQARLVLAIFLGLVVGKPGGILLASWLAVRTGMAEKPTSYSWSQLAGAGALAGIGFTMSLFIAGQAFPNEADFTAAKVAIFLASLAAGVFGAAILATTRTPVAEAHEEVAAGGRGAPRLPVEAPGSQTGSPPARG